MSENIPMVGNTYVRMRLIIVSLIFTVLVNSTFSQEINAGGQRLAAYPITDSSTTVVSRRNFHYTSTLAPTALIGFGVASLQMESLKQLNRSTRDEILEDHPRRLSLDNYTQYAPALLVYGFNIAGIKGTHNFRDRSIIYATSQLIAAAFVVPLKHIVNEERPDGSNLQSFPSGHTTTAFSSAQFMFREYQHENIWLSLSGYPFAIFTGVYRTINNRHWVGDVVAGAGFGILSTELAYRIYSKLNSRSVKPNNKKYPSLIMPFYQNHAVGISFSKTL